MRIKPTMLKITLMIEMCVFGCMYIFGKNGLQLLDVQKKELHALRTILEELQKEVVGIESEMSAWQAYDFYKEKVAREQLQMARKGDKLFYRGS